MKFERQKFGLDFGMYTFILIALKNIFLFMFVYKRISRG